MSLDTESSEAVMKHLLQVVEWNTSPELCSYCSQVSELAAVQMYLEFVLSDPFTTEFPYFSTKDCD